MATKTIPSRGGDFLLHMESAATCFATSTISNTTGAAQDLADVVGYPVKGTAPACELALDADQASITGWIIQGRPIVALAATSGETDVATPYTILNNTPAVINQAKWPATDAAAAAWTGGVAAIVTKAEALGYVVKDEPSKFTTQST
tara:strand:+ start:4611 stop:5051 length:441 start_codon:yes stop_codon:yes gene_type:complete